MRVRGALSKYLSAPFFNGKMYVLIRQLKKKCKYLLRKTSVLQKAFSCQLAELDRHLGNATFPLPTTADKRFLFKLTKFKNKIATFKPFLTLQIFSAKKLLKIKSATRKSKKCLGVDIFTLRTLSQKIRKILCLL